MAQEYKIIDIKKLTYDKALKRIQEITELLEDKNIDLTSSLKYFKESSELIDYCKSEITKVENEIKQIKIIEDN